MSNVVLLQQMTKAGTDYSLLMYLKHCNCELSKNYAISILATNATKNLIFVFQIIIFKNKIDKNICN